MPNEKIDDKRKNNPFFVTPDDHMEELRKTLVPGHQDKAKLQAKFDPQGYYYNRQKFSQILQMDYKHDPKQPAFQFLAIESDPTFAALTAMPAGFSAENASSVRNLPIHNTFIQTLIVERQGIMVTVFANGIRSSGFPEESNAQEENLMRETDASQLMPINYPETVGDIIGLDQIGSAYRLENVRKFKGNVAGLEPEGSPFSMVFVAAPDLRASKDRRDYVSTEEGRSEYVRYMAYLVRLQCEHAIQAKSNTLISGALGCGAFDNNPLLVAAIFRSVLKEERYKSLNVEFCILSKKDPDHQLLLSEVFEQVFACQDDSILNQILEQAPAYCPFYAKQQKEFQAQEAYQNLVSHSELSKKRKVASALPPEAIAAPVAAVPAAAPVAAAPAPAPVAAIPAAPIADSKQQRNITGELQAILDAKGLDLTKKSKMEVWINSNISTIDLAGLDELDTFFKKEAVCKLMTSRSIISSVFSKISKGQEGDTIMRIRVQLDKRRTELVGGQPLDEKSFIKLMQSQVYASLGQAKSMAPDDKNIAQMVHLVITPPAQDDGMPTQKAATKVNQYLLATKIATPGKMVCVVTATNTRYQKNYPEGSYFIRMYPEDYCTLRSKLPQGDAIMAQRFPETPAISAPPPQADAAKFAP